MHEMSIAQNIIQILDEVLQEHSGSRIVKVTLEIGELMAVVPESLQFCYEAITEGTPLEDSKLDIQIIPIVAECRDCGKKFPVESFRFVCPDCQSNQLQEISGRELNIKHLEVTYVGDNH